MNRDICLGRPPVHIATGQGKPCRVASYWPHCVRPADYYQRAYPVERRKIEKDGVPTTASLELAWKVADGEERSAFASSHWPELVAAANGEDCNDY